MRLRVREVPRGRFLLICGPTLTYTPTKPYQVQMGTFPEPVYNPVACSVPIAGGTLTDPIQRPEKPEVGGGGLPPSPLQRPVKRRVSLRWITRP